MSDLSLPPQMGCQERSTCEPKSVAVSNYSGVRVKLVRCSAGGLGKPMTRTLRALLANVAAKEHRTKPQNKVGAFTLPHHGGFYFNPTWQAGQFGSYLVLGFLRSFQGRKGKKKGETEEKEDREGGYEATSCSHRSDNLESWVWLSGRAFAWHAKTKTKTEIKNPYPGVQQTRV